MQFSQDSIFQLLTEIEQILKTYQQNHSEIDDIKKLFQQLQQMKISPEIIFQQLVANKDKILELKYTLYKHIVKLTAQTGPLKLQAQNQQKIIYNSDSFLNLEDASQILRKISAIKGQAMFINQELSIQKMQWTLDLETLDMLKRLSLRKLMKEYMKKSRGNSKLQFLIPLCIRLVVIQQTISVYLQKTLTFMCSILNQQCDLSIVDEQITNSQTIKSVSSLSASIEQFLQNQNRKNDAEAINISLEVQECPTFEPIIRSDFVFDRNNIERPYITVQDRRRRNNCCLWF